MIRKCTDTLLIITLLLTLGVGVIPAQAQNDIVLTLSIPPHLHGYITDGNLLAEFEAAHPGVRVVLHPVEQTIMAWHDLPTYLAELDTYTTSGDVLLFSDSSANTLLTPETIRAGYLLDLSPYANTDPTLNPADFYASGWQSFQWDNGLYGFPIALNPLVLTYKPAVFDAHGLAYPNTNWTISDFDYAIRQLTEIDSSGNVVVPGMVQYNDGTLLRSLVAASLYDTNRVPDMPALDNPALIPLVDTWFRLEQENLFGQQGFSGDYNAVPMQLEMFPVFSADSVMTLLPGDTAGLLQLHGAAVSRGTAYPQQAYELAKYLSADPRLAQIFGLMFQSIPARATVLQSGIVSSAGFAPDMLPLAEQVANSALPLPEIRYADYLTLALDKMDAQGYNASYALQEVAYEVTHDLARAADHASTPLYVASAPNPNQGGNALNFGIAGTIPNQAEWDQAIMTFTANEAAIDQIVLGTDTRTGTADLLDRMAAEYDCFYLPYNAVPEANLNSILSLDPLLLDDASFDPNDMIGLAQVQRDQQTWGYPLTITPKTLWYDADLFAQVGLTITGYEWSTPTFVGALQAVLADHAVVSNWGLDYSTTMLMLIAAYGGLPLDYRTTPPTVNFTDPATVEAIRQVLDLAKSGVIQYQPLDFVTAGVMSGGGHDLNVPIYSISLGQQTDTRPQFRPIMFPQGTYTPVSYAMGTAYISANAADPNACYRWIRALAQQPHLLGGMPAQHSRAADPLIATTQGADVAAFYQAFEAALQAPTTVEFPAHRLTSGTYFGLLDSYWLGRAFDRYVLENADLASELQDAELITRAYQDCIAAIPPYDPALHADGAAYLGLYDQCAARVDPAWSGSFGR